VLNDEASHAQSMLGYSGSIWTAVGQLLVFIAGKTIGLLEPGSYTEAAVMHHPELQVQ